jgi:hypothetical protein
MTGLLVKVWFALLNPWGVAATVSRIVVTHGGNTGTTWIRMYDLTGTQLWAVGGTELTAGVTTNVGVLLGGPAGVRFSHDGSYVIVAESNSNRVTKWSTSTGAYLGLVGYNQTLPYDVQECWTGSGVGTLVAEAGNNRVSRVSETGTITVTTIPSAIAVALAPGRGMMVSSRAAGLYFLTSVVIASHPASSTVVAGSSVTLTVALTAGSATAGLTFAWTKNGVAVGTSSASYTYTAVSADGGQSLSILCTVTHAMGRAVTNAAMLTVQVSCDMSTQVAPHKFIA